MANPITWQNIHTSSQGNPAQFMQLAQTGIDGAFDKLQGVLKQRETTDQANWDQIGVNNAEAFKSALYGMTTPDQMAAAQKSGQFNEMLTGYGAQVKDPAALRALMDGRLATLQGQATANSVFTDATLDRQQQPERDALQIRALKGDPEAITAIEASSLRNRAPLVKEAVSGAADLVERTRKGAEFKDRLLNSDSTRKLQGAQATALGVQSADAALTKQISNHIATKGLEAATKLGEVQTKFGALASSLGLPTSRGFVDTDNLTREQQTQLDAAGVTAGLGKFGDVPTMSTAFRAVSGELAKTSPDHARIVASGQDALLAQFDASKITTDYGAFTDRNAKALAKAREQSIYNNDKGKPVMTPAQMSDDLAEYVKKVVPEGNRQAALEGLSRHITKGYKQPDGTIIPYPLAAAKDAINQTDYPWWGNFWGIRDGAGDSTTRLDEWMKNPANMERTAEGLNALSAGDRALFTDTLFPKGSKAGAASNSKPAYRGAGRPSTSVKNPSQ